MGKALRTHLLGRKAHDRPPSVCVRTRSDQSADRGEFGEACFFRPQPRRRLATHGFARHSGGPHCDRKSTPGVAVPLYGYASLELW